MRAFVVLCLVFSIPWEEIGLGKRLLNDLFCVECDVKPQLNQSSARNHATEKVTENFFLNKNCLCSEEPVTARSPWYQCWGWKECLRREIRLVEKVRFKPEVMGGETGESTEINDWYTCKGWFTAHELNWIQLQFACVDSIVNSRTEIHVLWTHWALIVLVSLQPVNTKYSRNADARDQYTRRLTVSNSSGQFSSVQISSFAMNKP